MVQTGIWWWFSSSALPWSASDFRQIKEAPWTDYWSIDHDAAKFKPLII
jgi:hypothetical protein